MTITAEIRPPRPSDAFAVSQVLRRSILECCVADHGNDPLQIEQWLANKSEKNVRLWIEHLQNFAVVGEVAAQVVGTAM